jgi:hypothetical protein
MVDLESCHQGAAWPQLAHAQGVDTEAMLEGMLMAVFCGIDWSEDHHDVAVVDADGRLVAKRRISDDVAGFGQLLGLLAEAGDSPTAPMPVAIETARVWAFTESAT